MTDFDTLVRRVDEDRWLASRFAPAQLRARLIAIYAVNYEIARLAETVREPGLGHIRLAWWREALDDIHGGRSALAHPALEALVRSAPPRDAVMALADTTVARGRDFEAEPFATWADIEGYVDGTAGALMRAAMTACGAFGDDAKAFAAQAARAWGFAGLARAAPQWAARGRALWPAPELIDAAEAVYADARRLAPKQTPALFPAFGYVALLPGYLRALRRGGNATSTLGRRLTLIAAAATGRI